MIWLRQLIPVLFRDRRAENPKRNPAEKAARKMCACSTRDRSLWSLILARGQLRPPLHPPDQERCSVDHTKAFRLWTPDCGRLRSPPGPPSPRRVPPWTRSRAFAPLHHEPGSVPPRCPCPTLGGLDAPRIYAHKRRYEAKPRRENLTWAAAAARSERSRRG
jgi:hypothetical protein